MTITQYKDEDFSDPRRLAVGIEGMSLDHQLRGYANQHLLDGLVPKHALVVLGALAFLDSKAKRDRALAKLVEHGYVHDEGATSCDRKGCPLTPVEGKAKPPVAAGHVLVCDWFKNQERRAVVIERREKNTRKKDLLGDEFLVAQLIVRDGHRCRYCGCPVKKTSQKDTRSKAKLTIDHIDPDGGNDIANLVIACLGCNSRKNGRTPEEAGMTLLPAPRIARLGHLDLSGDESWIDPTDQPDHHTERARDHHENQTTDQTTDQKSGLVAGLVHQDFRDHRPDHGPEDSSRAPASPARDARDSGRTTDRDWSAGLVSGLVGTGPGLVEAVVAGSGQSPPSVPRGDPSPATVSHSPHTRTEGDPSWT